MEARTSEITRGRVTQLNVLRLVIYGQFICALCTAATCALIGRHLISSSLFDYAVVPWLFGALFLLASLATIAGTSGILICPPLVLLLACLGKISWRQRLTAVALEGVAVSANWLALLPWCQL